MIDRWLKKGWRFPARLAALAILALPAWNLQLAAQQQKPSAQSSPAATASAYEASAPPEERKRSAELQGIVATACDKNPEHRVEELREFLTKNPEAAHLRNVGLQMAYCWETEIHRHTESTEWLVANLKGIDEILRATDRFTASVFEVTLARLLQKSNVALPLAAQMTQDSLDHLREEDFIANEQKEGGEIFDKADAAAHFQHSLAERYSLLGSIQLALSQEEEEDALQSLRKALAVRPDMQAYKLEAALEEKQGNRSGAFDMLSDAYLTGRLDAASIEHLKKLYAELYPPGDPRKLDAMLDEKYRTTFHNPVPATPYTAGPGRSDRVVLAELFTGAGCEPCVAPDLAFEASLQRYRSSELALVAYHDNAPFLDPLANDVTTERAAYYQTGGATPHVYLDGESIHTEEGLPAHAPAAFQSISKEIDRHLEMPSNVELKVTAARHGDKVNVSVQGAGKNLRKPEQLHIDLVEKNVGYSGENGLRLQPMVVRASAEQRGGQSGFLIRGRLKFKQKYVFDLKKVEAANSSYYERYIASLKEQLGSAAELFTASYREKKVSIDPDRLAVVVFLQDGATKSVVQAAYTDVKTN